MNVVIAAVGDGLANLFLVRVGWWQQLLWSLEFVPLELDAIREALLGFLICKIEPSLETWRNEFIGAKVYDAFPGL